ncbi:MAG: hypothetical protein J7M19_09235 [Planctomycetes bacterium]|nr:hypothetical protein [Planctomycetota bacterium]
MSIKLGMDARLYFCAAGMGGSPTWTELTNVKDVTLNLETGEADVTTRGNAGWRASVATLKDGSIEFEMVWDTEDAGFTAIKDAYFNNTAIAFAVMDGRLETAGSQGLQADFTITNFSRNEPLEEALTVSVTAKPTYSTVAPAWVTVA